MGEFKSELESLINRYCQENDSNTSDFILATYLYDCLQVWNRYAKMRDTWYGVVLEPGNSHFTHEVTT